MTTKRPTSTVNESKVNVTRPTVRRRQVNWWLLIVSLIVAAVLGPSIYAWHRFQLERVAAALLEKADEMDEAGLPGEAAEYLHRYLQMEITEDRADEILPRLAATYDRSVDTMEGKATAIQWYYRALGATPERVDLRVRVAELFLDTEQFTLAAAEADKCLAGEPENAAALRVRALAKAGQYGTGQSVPLQAVIGDLEVANRYQPGDISLADTLASLYRNKLAAADGPARAQQADHVMDQMVQNSSDPHQAYLARYEYRTRYGLPGADDDLRRAIEAQPEHPDVVFAAAKAAQRTLDHEVAELRFRQAIQRMPDDHRGYLGLGNALLAAGRADEALEAWQQGVNVVKVGRLSLLIRIGDTQISLNRLADAKETIQRIDKVIGRLAASGRESMRNWAVSSRDLLHAKIAFTEERFDRAVSLLRQVASTAKATHPEQPEASPSFQAWLLLGQTYVRLQRWDDAAHSFERSLHASPDSNDCRIWAARCWNKLGQYDKSIALCEQAIQRPPVPRSIWLMLAELHLRKQLNLLPAHRDWAALRNLLEDAKTHVPDSWEIRCLQATQLIASEARTPKQLEKSQRQAVQILLSAESIAPDSLAMWTRLIFYYDLLDQPEHVERALIRVGELSNNPALSSLYSAAVHARRGAFREASDALDRLPPPTGDPETSIASLEHQKHWFAAQAFRRTGQTDRAREEYEQALQLAPDHPELQIEFASFLRPTNPRRSEAMLRDLLRDQPGHPHARRLLASWLHWSTDQSLQQEARKLLSHSNDQDVMADRRLDAALRMRRGGSSDLAEARALLEKNLAEGGTAEDLRILAKLCELQGDQQSAEDHLRQLANQSDATPQDLANFVDYLIRTDQAQVAERWLARLHSIAPINFASFSLRLRYMAATGETVGLERYADEYIQNWRATDMQPTAAVDIVRRVARLLEELGRLKAAEKWCLLLSDQYSHHEELAFFWIRQDKLDQALTFCAEKAREDATPANATVLARMLLNADESSPAFRSCWDLVFKAGDEHPDDSELQFALANLNLVNGHVQPAIDGLRHVTELAPEHVLAWNNLAALLADQQGRQSEAMECINQAIAIVGQPVPMLLDTKAVLLLQQNQPAEAAALLRQAVSSSDRSDPRFQFHLAVALFRIGELQEAQELWSQAGRLGLNEAYLTDYELQWMGELNDTLASDENPS